MSCRPINRWMFGKLPSLGDFVARGLDAPLRDSLDTWLSVAMQDARARFPDDFEQRYDQAPAWHFVDCDADGRWSGGALCASIDRVGRRFPLMLAAPAGNAAEAAAMAGGCLNVLHRAFADGWDADGLMAADLAPVVMPWSPDRPEWALIGEGGPAVTASGRFPDAIICTMTEMAA